VSIRTKLILGFAPLLLLVIAVTGFLIYRIASNQIMKATEEQQRYLTQQTVVHMDYIAQDAIDISMYLYLASEVRAMLNNDTQEFHVKNKAFDMVNRLMTTRQFFHSLLLYSDKVEPIDFNTKAHSSPMPYNQFVTTDYYREALAGPNEPHWSYSGPPRALFIGDSSGKILMTRALQDYMNPLKVDGFVVVGINESALRSNISPPGGDTSAKTFIINGNGMVLADSEGAWGGHPYRNIPELEGMGLEKERGISQVNSGSRLITYATSQLTGWRIVIWHSNVEQLRQLNRTKQIIGISIISAFLIILLLSWAGASAIVRPITSMLLSMRKFQKGDFSQKVLVTTKDEIGHLGNGYNEMVRRIELLVNDIYLSKLRQREAELKALQSQIHPHFLYNVLNTISWTARSKGNPEIAEMIEALSQMFRLRLNRGKDMTTLEEEAALVDNYLKLQSLRFGSRLSYEISLDPRVAALKVPSLLLQPLAENSVIHGLEPLQGNGFLHILAYPENGGTVLEVVDNGVGMDEQQLQALKVQWQFGEAGSAGGTEDRQGGFALPNVRERLMLLYGAEASFEFHSRKDYGTRIRVFIPRGEGTDFA